MVRELRRLAVAFALGAGLVSWGSWCGAEQALPQAIVVAQDGSGDYQSIQQALESIPYDNAQRVVIEIRDGVYREKVRIDAHRVTLRGESRQGTRVEFNQPREQFEASPDELGVGVVNILADDVILERLTVVNTIGEVGPHAFAVFGRGTRTIIQDANCVSRGADTVALWNADAGMYYHANCSFEGAVDFVCPRGRCFVRDSRFFEHKAGSASLWHDGDGDRKEKFVLRNCYFDGVPGFLLGRRHREGQFYLLDCTFSSNMADHPIWRVTYPDEPERNQPNLWGDRYYYHNCRREGGAEFAWYADNLHEAPGSPAPEAITAAWTFDGQWDPERTDAPKIEGVRREGDVIEVKFSEDVTVIGRPLVRLKGGGVAVYAEGSGRNRLRFHSPGFARPAEFDPAGGAVIASLATSQTRSVPRQKVGAEATR